MNSNAKDHSSVIYKISLFFIGIVLSSYLFYHFILLPKWLYINELTKQYHDYYQKVYIIEKFVQTHPNPEPYLVELDHKITQIDQLIPNTIDISSFFLQIEGLAQESGIQIDSFKPGKIENKEGYREITIEILLDGDFLQLMGFLNKIENLPRFTSITDIAMQFNNKKLISKVTAKIFSHGVSPAVITTMNEHGNGHKK